MTAYPETISMEVSEYSSRTDGSAAHPMKGEMIKAQCPVGNPGLLVGYRIGYI
jgi:hypothetical protein